MPNNPKLWKAAQRGTYAIKQMAERTPSENLKNREAQELLAALDSLEWFGNFDPLIQREIEDARDHVVELSNYETAEEVEK